MLLKPGWKQGRFHPGLRLMAFIILFYFEALQTTPSGKKVRQTMIFENTDGRSCNDGNRSACHRINGWGIVIANAFS